MGKRVKKIKKDIRMGWILKAMETVIVLTGIFWLILLGMKETGRMPVMLVIALVILMAAVIVSGIAGSIKGSQAARRIRNMGEGFEEETFTKAGDCLYIGENWLVYRRKEDWLFWRKNRVERIVVRDHNGLGTRADIVVYQRGMYAGETFHLNGADYDLLEALEQWPQTYTD